MSWLVWHIGNGVGYIKEDKLATSIPVSTWIRDHVLWQVYHSGIFQGHSGLLSLAIPLWVGAMSTVDAFGHLGKKRRVLLFVICLDIFF